MTREVPILMSAPMVRALSLGLKTQTRRLRHPAEPGDRLWVRETWATRQDLAPLVEYRADRTDAEAFEKPYSHIYDEATRWGASIHMPRWASRFLLEVTATRWEPVQAITVQDAIAEGTCIRHDFSDHHDRFEAELEVGPRACFRSAWNGLNAARGAGWAANPMVKVITFRRVAR